ncbi:hypothetical protein Pmani_023360 [Petrolisthes manimaculis]|uniref:Uncharacterized protein n=1 Tax=Petrolisthes manimaculis TaxID=1843537 RepID=A0AAE1PC37_9EUCA|nr:hypothetical protein Pmani_023360 [Petrolisthes manimaculis]
MQRNQRTAKAGCTIQSAHHNTPYSEQPISSGKMGLTPKRGWFSLRNMGRGQLGREGEKGVAGRILYVVESMEWWDMEKRACENGREERRVKARME